MIHIIMLVEIMPKERNPIWGYCQKDLVSTKGFICNYVVRSYEEGYLLFQVPILEATTTYLCAPNRVRKYGNFLGNDGYPY